MSGSVSGDQLLYNFMYYAKYDSNIHRSIIILEGFFFQETSKLGQSSPKLLPDVFLLRLKYIFQYFIQELHIFTLLFD